MGRAFNVLAWSSLALCLASAGLWGRSYVGAGGSWNWPAGATVQSPRRLQFHVINGEAGVNVRLGPLGKPVIGYWGTRAFTTVIYGTMSGRRFVQVQMPLWLP